MMAYERLDEVLKRLKDSRDTQKAIEEQKRQAALEAAMEFARIKAEVVCPVFIEITARLAASGFSGEILDQTSDPISPISLIVDLSDDDRPSQKESLRIVFDQEKGMCGFDRAKGSTRDIQTNLLGRQYSVDEISEDLVSEKAEEMVALLVTEEIKRGTTAAE
jgi:hypothetical protein